MARTDMLSKRLERQGVTVKRVAVGHGPAITAEPERQQEQPQYATTTVDITSPVYPTVEDNELATDILTESQPARLAMGPTEDELYEDLKLAPKGSAMRHQSPYPTVGISADAQRIALNGQAGRQLGGFENLRAVRLHYSPKYNTMVIEPVVPGTDESYRVTASRPGQGQISCTTFLRFANIVPGEHVRRYRARSAAQGSSLESCLIISLNDDNLVNNGTN